MDEGKRAYFERQLAGSPYRVIGHLGRGSVAEVLLVEHEVLGKPFALKIVHPHLRQVKGYVERLVREAQVVAALECENVVRIIDLGTTGEGQPFLVLERLIGRSLATDLLRRRKLPMKECLLWMSHLLSGLAAAHRKGVVHRDLTPQNLFLQELPSRPGKATGRTERLKIMDFGLAGFHPEGLTSSSRLPELATSTGALVGTPAYASPEALRGEPLDARADLYAAGLICFEMLTGLNPLELTGESLPEAPLPSELLHALSRATHRDRDRRFQSAEAFERALQRAAGVAHGDPT